MSINLVCGTGEDCSVLSTVCTGWDSIVIAFEHPILRFFTMEEAAKLRCVCREFEDAVSIAPFRMLDRVIPPACLPGWLASFPHANVRKVLLSDVSIGDAGATALAAALPVLPALTTLNLIIDSIGDDGATAIAAALPSLKALTTLNLSYNSIGDAGATALAAALPSLTALTTLELGENSIRGAGMTALAAALPVLKALVLLDLSNNNIDAAGATALAAALPDMTALTALDLHRNFIREEGALALASALHHLRLLRDLDMSYNDIGNTGMLALIKVLPTMTALKLKVVKLHNNNIGFSGTRAIHAFCCAKVANGCTINF